MKKLLILAAMAGAMALPGLANAADITGAWKVAVNVADMTFHSTCDFKQAGAALSSDTAMAGKLSVAGMEGAFTATKG